MAAWLRDCVGVMVPQCVFFAIRRDAAECQRAEVGNAAVPLVAVFRLKLGRVAVSREATAHKVVLYLVGLV